MALGVRRAVRGAADRRLASPLAARGRSVGAGRAVVAVGGSPSAPYTLGAGRQCSPARLCAVSWAGSVSRIASGARLRRTRGHRAGRSQSAIGCTPGGGPRTALAQCSRARWPDEPGPHLRTGCVPACSMPHWRCQWPDDPASGSVTRPVALAPRIGRNMGRWLQSQSESGWPDHGPNGVHGRRAEPGASHVPITAGAASRQVQTCTSSNLP